MVFLQIGHFLLIKLLVLAVRNSRWEAILEILKLVQSNGNPRNFIANTRI